MAQRKNPPHLFSEVETGSKGKKGGTVTKGGREKKEEKCDEEMEKVWKRPTFILFTLSNQFQPPPAGRQPQTGKTLLPK